MIKLEESKSRKKEFLYHRKRLLPNFMSLSREKEKGKERGEEKVWKEEQIKI